MQLFFYLLIALALLLSLLGLDVKRCSLIRSQRLDLLVLVVALVLAGITDIVVPATLGLLLLASVYLIYRQRVITEKWIVFCGDIAVMVLGIALGLHLISGIEPWIMQSDIVVSPGANSIRLAANFDKGIAGIFLMNLTMTNPRLMGCGITPWQRFVIIVGGVVLVWMIAALAGVALQPKWSEWVYLFALNNLLFTCIAEEALFRGVIQRQLQAWLTSFRHGGVVALLTASVIFGAAHLPGGLVWAAFATIAGLVYGLAYALTGRLSAAVLAHIGVNLGHFCLFVYPLA